MSDERSKSGRFDDGRAFFGRRVSHRPRGGREAAVAALLPKLRVAIPARGPLDPRELFDGAMKDVWLEIGFGGGEHLLARAEEHPDIGFIGCEAYIDGVAKLVGEIARRQLNNIRIHDGDAIRLVDRLPDASVGLVYLLYPDPWPKRRQRKRRFISDDRLAALARILKSGGELRFATDIDDYAAWALARVMRSPDWVWTAESPDDWRRPWPNWPGTRYEAKATREGRAPIYLAFRRL